MLIDDLFKHDLRRRGSRKYLYADHMIKWTQIHYTDRSVESAESSQVALGQYLIPKPGKSRKLL